MAELDYLHVCDSAFQMEGGKHCIIGIFDVIHASNFPATHSVMTIAMRLRGQAHETVSLKIELARPNGDVLVSLPANIVAGADGSAFVNVNLVNTQFPEVGRYIVKVASAGRTLVSHSLQLVKAQGPPSGQQGPPPKVH